MPPLADLHPLLWLAMATWLLLDTYVLWLVWRRWRLYRGAPHWPRLQVAPERVDLLRVVHSREGLPTGTRQHHEAVLHFSYEVNGQSYRRTLTKTVADRESAEALKREASLSFLYNPDNPAETLEAAPGPQAFCLSVLGLLVVNGMGLGFVTQLSGFLHP